VGPRAGVDVSDLNPDLPARNVVRMPTALPRYLQKKRKVHNGT